MKIFGKEESLGSLDDAVRDSLAHRHKTRALINGLAIIVLWVVVWAIASVFLGLETIESSGQWVLLAVMGVVSIGTLLFTGAFVDLFGEGAELKTRMERQQELLQQEKALVQKEQSEISDMHQEMTHGLQEINDKLDKEE